MVSRPLGTLLSILLLTLGIGMISLILHIDHHVQRQMSRNIKDIDMVVGAKGSPLQLILSAVYQIDAPTGNISWDEAQKLAKNRLIEFGIPLSYGDNHEGYRIVGTDHQYPKLYDASISTGQLWQKPFEVSIGSEIAAQLDLKIGDSFSGSHGLTDDEEVHEEHAYTVVGIFNQTNSVLDQLILTSLESVWDMHNHETEEEENNNKEEHDHEEHESHDHDDEGDHHHEGDEHDHHEHESQLEITAMLVSFKSPMGIVQIPRMVNEQTNMQAAVPVYEIDRLFGLMGVSIEILNIIALIIIVVSGISIFISLYSALKERRYEMALMRTYGASPWQISALVIQEGLMLTTVSLIMGFIGSRIGLVLVSEMVQTKFHYSFAGLGWLMEEWILLAASIGIGLLASIIPAIQAFKLNISKTLADA